MNGPQLLGAIAVVIIVLVIAWFLGLWINVLTIGLGLLFAAGVIAGLKAIGFSIP